MKQWFPQEQIFWQVKRNQGLCAVPVQQLKQSIKADVVVVGGGMAGISAAQACAEKGLAVVLLEQYFVGAQASGKSSGFITPDAELDLTYFKKVFGDTVAQQLWRFVESGSNQIDHNIKTHDLDCDYCPEDTLIVALNKAGLKDITQEYRTRSSYGYESTLYDAQNINTVFNAQGYRGGVRYGASFGINPFAYLQTMKELLIGKGVRIYEESPVIDITHNRVHTVHGHSVTAEHIILCTDYATTQLGLLSKSIYHAQTFVAVTSPLSDKEIATLYPQGRVMAWDTDLVYTYFRLTADNRFMIGGGTVFSSYSYQTACHPTHIYKKLDTYCKKHFPQMNFTFEYIWPGLIGVSKDIMPLVGRDPHNPSLYHATAATGLSWAAAIGKYTVEHIFDNRHDLDQYFTPQRPFLLGGWFNTLFGSYITFSLSNLVAMKVPGVMRWIKKS